MDKTTIKEKCKKVSLVAIAATGTVCAVGLGVLCYMKTKEIEQLKIDKKNLKLDLDIFKEAYDGLVYKLEKKEETAELVKNVVGGPLIDRLIKNEELKLSRIDNKIQRMLINNLDEAGKKAVKIKQEDRQQILETIADFYDVKEALK